MWNNDFLYLAFIIQVVFISWYMSKMIVVQTKNKLDQHPQKQYPRLYPVSRDTIDVGVNIFKNMNRVILLIGIFIIIYGAYTQCEEMLNIDSSAVLLGFFLLQYIPYLTMEISGFKFLKLMRQANKSSVRRADLQPRKIFNYFPSFYLPLLIVSNLVFVGVVEYFVRHPFDGFGGYYNLIVIIIIDAFMLSIFAWNIHGKTKNPHLSIDDFTAQMEKIAKIMSLTVTMVTIFSISELIMSATDTRHFFDGLLSLYFSLLAFIGMSAYRVDDLNFEVYREN